MTTILYLGELDGIEFEGAVRAKVHAYSFDIDTLNTPILIRTPSSGNYLGIALLHYASSISHDFSIYFGATEFLPLPFQAGGGASHALGQGLLLTGPRNEELFFKTSQPIKGVVYVLEASRIKVRL